MKISKENFFLVGANLNLSKEQLEDFWLGIEKRENDSDSTPFAKYLFYFGALIIISAMTWFINLAWELLGGGGLFIIGSLYALAFMGMGALTWNKRGLRIPAGLFITIAVCMVPLTVYGLEAYFNIWPEDNPGTYQSFYEQIKGSWIFMEIATILAGVLAIRFFPFPFLTAPIFFSAWFLAIDAVPLILGENATLEQKYWISTFTGLVMIAIGIIVDFREKEDYGFWSNLFGTLTFWIGLNTLVWDKGERVLFFYFLINIFMMCFSVFLKRSVLMILGALGVFIYLGYLAHKVFNDFILFPFALSFIGIALIYLGILYQKNKDWIEKNMFDRLPTSIRMLLDKRRDL
jgi:hypothetical protein